MVGEADVRITIFFYTGDLYCLCCAQQQTAQCALSSLSCLCCWMLSCCSYHR